LKTQKFRKTIPNLVDEVKRLDGIIKTCNDEDLKTIFNKFKENLAYTNVTEDDINNLKELSKYVNSQQSIICRDPSSNIKSNKKSDIISAIIEVNVILDYIKRYTSPLQHNKDADQGGGKKHRKRYIKNKQNNNKNNNITMKKKRRNRKRAPVMKTIRNKKEQE
jgi:hypothetical protein